LTAFGVTILAAAGVALAPMVIAGVGFAVVAVAGALIGYVINTSGVKDKALRAFREWSSNTTINQPDFQNSDLYQGMMVAP
ncbi:hypothetical protein, partial [Nitrincola nitratireducens]|uniref:hypothetical protein n=1 Tax=Nitrincola nitratireducens TaxID=1229521 RepID=UPI0012F95959